MQEPLPQFAPGVPARGEHTLHAADPLNSSSSARAAGIDAPSVRAGSASNSVAVTLTVTGVAAGGEKLSMVSLDTAATAKLLKPPPNTTLPLAAPGLPLHAQAQPHRAP